MKTLRNIVSLAVIGAMLVFTGCEEEQSTQTVSKEDAIATLEENSANLTASLQNMQNTQGMKAMGTLAALGEKNNPFDQTKATSGQTVLKSIQKAIKPVQKKELKKLGEQPFDFESHTGIYTWLGPGNWEKAPSDSIIIRFPADTSADPIENNGEFILADYAETTMTDTAGETVYVPTVIDAKLLVDGEEVMSVDWTMETENFDGTTILKSLDATVKLHAYTYTLSLSQSSISAAISVEEQDLPIMSVNMSVLMMTNMEDIKKVDGNFQVLNLIFKGWIEPYDMQHMEDADVTTREDMVAYLNEQMDLSAHVYNTGKKIADIKFVLDEDSDDEMFFEPVFVFKDGSEEPIENHFQELQQYLQNLASKYDIS